MVTSWMVPTLSSVSMVGGTASYRCVRVGIYVIAKVADWYTQYKTWYLKLLLGLQVVRIQCALYVLRLLVGLSYIGITVVPLLKNTHTRYLSEKDRIIWQKLAP